MWAPARSNSPATSDVVFQVVLRPRGGKDVAGVAQRALAQLALLAHRVHRDAHVLHPVQAVEHAEQVDAARPFPVLAVAPPRGLAHEVAHHVVGVVGVADAVGTAQQHLEQEVRRSLAHQGEPLPRVLGEEAHGDVEGGAAPALQAQQLRQHPRVGARDGGDVVRAHPRGQQRLVPVAHGRVGDEDFALLAHPGGEAFRAKRIEPLLRAVGHGRPRLDLHLHRWHGRARVGGRARAILRLGMAVHRHVRDPRQELRRAILSLDGLEQLGRAGR